MNVTIHQPYFIPYIGFFSKVYSSEVLVLYDTAQYVKNRLDNRNYINYDNKKTLLTVPIAKHMSFKPLREIVISNHYDWKEEHKVLINRAYADHQYFQIVNDLIDEIYSKEFTFLSEINSCLIVKLLSLFGWKGEIIYSSHLDIDPLISPSKKILSILKKTNATKYIAGPSSKKYLDINLLENDGIEVDFHEYKIKTYNQKSKIFLPNLSIIDYICNIGVKEFSNFVK